MSGTNEDVEFTLKVMINKQKTKVLFAEIDSDFADVLISFLTFPLGTIVRVLKKHYGDVQETRVNIGSLTTLYDGLANLDNDHFETEAAKEMLLDPISSFEAERLRLKIDMIRHPRTIIRYLSCEDWNCEYGRSKLSMANYFTGACRCGKSLNRKVGLLEESEAAEDGTAEVFVTKKTTLLISDDLRMVPSVAVSIMQTLTNLGITDTGGAELRIVTFGFNEIMDLLKGSLLSRTPLSDIILEKGRVVDFGGTRKSEPGVMLNERKKEETSSSKKMILRLMVQKSNSKLLFAQAGDDFAKFLFSFLTIPIGGVECLLGGNTRLKSIDNLYNCIADIDDKYMATRDMRYRIKDPKLPSGYISANQILPLSEQTLVYCYHQDFDNKKEWFSYSGRGGGKIHEMHYDKGDGNYVKQGLTMYTVADDLTVTPLCMTSSLSILNEMKIPLSDVKEVEVQIGVEEALSILKASLTSTSALTDGLMINPGLKKQSKQEH